MAFLNKVKEIAEKILTPDEKNRESVSLSDSNDVLLGKMKFRLDNSEKILKDKKQQWDRNLRFFKGKHWQVANISVPTYKANIVINKWFAAVRSLVAFETDAKPDPLVEANVDYNKPDAQILIGGAKKVEASLDYCWDKRHIPNILTQIYYDRYNMDDGFGMYFWNNELDDVDFEQVKTYEILEAPGATDIDDAEYIIVSKWRNRKWFETYYPEDVDKIKFEAPKEKEDMYYDTDKKAYENMAKVYYYFENETWITFTDKLLLDKTKNRYWEWRTPEEQRADLIKEVGNNNIPIDWKPVRNHLEKPRKPIIHFKGYYLGGEFRSQSLAQQAFNLNMAINKRKCQIQDNADGMGNPQKVIDPSVPKDKVDLITSQPGLKIRINPTLYRTEPGAPLPEFIFADLQHSEQKFDDMVGHHDISRGGITTKRQTAREAMLLRETDVTPVRLLMRNSEVAITELLNGWVQLKKLFYDQAHYIGKSGAGLQEGAGTFLIRDEIPNSLSITIKVGSTLPVSREAKRAEYIRDFQMGVLDPKTYLTLMNYPNPEKILKRLLNWQQGVISDQEPQEGIPLELQQKNVSAETATP